MSEIFSTLGGALELHPELFADPTSVGLWTALGVALIAAFSSMLGHMAILVLNRLRGWLVVSSLLLTFLSLIALYASQAFATWAVASVWMRAPQPVLPLIIVAALAMAPQVFAVFTALPHIGLILGRFLEIWAFIIFWYGVSKVFVLNWSASLIVSLAGWLVMQLLSRLLHRPISWVVSRVWRLATGRPTMITSKDVLAGTPIIPVEGVTKRELRGSR